MHLRFRGRSTQAVVALVLLPLLLGACRQSSLPEEPKPEPAVLAPSSHGDLEAFFASLDYDWETVHAGVPPFILETLPSDLSRTRVSERKRLFFLSMLPMVLLVNEEITSQREEFLAIAEAHDRGKPLDLNQVEWLAQLAADYRVEGNPLGDPEARRQLLARLDIVPPSLALAQAACESGYGTSRFARMGNNLFGEWTFTPGTGIVPAERPAGETYEVRRFESVYDSLRSYVRNLNTNQAYRSFRLHRARLRAEGRPLAGYELARGLTRYSVRGEEYVSDIRSIIRRNRLSLLADATLRQNLPEDIAGAGLLSSRIAPLLLAARDQNPTDE